MNIHRCSVYLIKIADNYRGIGNMILSHSSDPSNNGKNLHFYCSSGGNAGLAAVVAARDLGYACTIVVPHSTKQYTIDKLRAAGASEVLQHGANWSEADTFLRETFIDVPKQQESSNVTEIDDGVKNVYIHPFDHPIVWEGHSTLISELVDQLPAREDGDDTQFPADVIICSVGGGGLFNGLIYGVNEYYRTHPKDGPREKKLDVLAVETKGADSLAYSLQNGALKSLDAITSIATTLSALCVAPKAFQNALEPPEGVKVTSVVVSDAEAARGVVTFADEMRILVEPACGLSIDVALGARLREAVTERKLGPDSRVVVVVCGGSAVTPEVVAEYRSKLAQGWV
jgi:L-serine/L-threonine ammonia-lyase